MGTLLSQYGGPDKFAWEYDAQKGKYVDMIRAGIVDPLKVVRTALVDASGIASLLTTSEACVVDAPEEDKPAVGGSMGGGMGGMGGFKSSEPAEKYLWIIYYHALVPYHPSLLHLTCITVIYILISNTHHSAILCYPQWYQTFMIRINDISELILSVRIY